MNCIDCGCEIPLGRMEFLVENDLPQTCLLCASASTVKKKMVDFGEDGVDTVICDSVRDCSLSSIFEDGEDDQDEE